MAGTRKMNILVGTCGFAEAQDRLFQDFGILEVQVTFYQPPKATTAARWREKAPEGFVFTLKAWQLLTHEASSPTYRRLQEALSEQALARAGSFRWNEITRMAWDRTQEIAEALRAEAVVFQTPRSFRPTPENLRRIERFFGKIERRGRRMIFEPRGETWNEQILRRLTRDLDLVHGVDPFLAEPLGGDLRYFRLHGKPAYHYRYRYTDADLRSLILRLDPHMPNRVLFNNDSMAEDARRFLRLLTSGSDR